MHSTERPILCNLAKCPLLLDGHLPILTMTMKAPISCEHDGRRPSVHAHGCSSVAPSVAAPSGCHTAPGSQQRAQQLLRWHRRSPLSRVEPAKAPAQLGQYIAHQPAYLAQRMAGRNTRLRIYTRKAHPGPETHHASLPTSPSERPQGIMPTRSQGRGFSADC